MSSRALRKLQGDQGLVVEGLSDEPEELDVTIRAGARKKQFNINQFDLLTQQSLSESEVKEDDDRETEVTPSGHPRDGVDPARRKKKKKKRKVPGKGTGKERSSEDNLEGDEIDRSIREVNKILGEAPAQETVLVAAAATRNRVEKGIFNIEHKNLIPDNEMKRIFGWKVIQSEQCKRKGRGRPHLKTTWLVSPKHNWPQVGKPGISMSLVEKKNGVQYFTFEHNSHYQQIQMKFLEAVESFNPDNIVAILNVHPYHVDALIQLSEICKMGEDLQMATELIERALYCMECSFHPLFNLAQGNCRLDYKKQENRSFFIALFKHLLYVGQRACYRTALEFCKVIFSLDPENDPMCVTLMVDFYALRASEYSWLIRMFDELEHQKNLSQLPNFAFSVALAHFHLACQDGSDLSVADDLLQKAVIMFPGGLIPLLEKCSVQPDPKVSSHQFFDSKAQASQSTALIQLIQLYIGRCYHLWKEAEVLPWLERNVHKVVERVNNGDPYVKECEQKRKRRYQGTPRNIYRHIILSEIKDANAALSVDLAEGVVMGFDPLPPVDSVNIYTRPLRPRMQDNSNVFSLFFRSVLPNFNTSDLQRAEDQLEGAAGGTDSGGGADLRRSVTSLLDAMRDLLSNIHLPDLPNDADADDSDEEAN